MQNAEYGNAPGTRYQIRYARFGDTAGNPDPRGKGLLGVEGFGERFVFSGKRRGGLPFGRSIEIAFRPDQIWNVAVRGKRIQFSTSEGSAGRRKLPFFFYCNEPDTASRIAGLLPSARDSDFQQQQQFDANLRGYKASNICSSVTNLLVAANVLVFIGMGCLGAGWLTPSEILAYVRFGVSNAAATTDGEWWRLLTSMFIHFGAMHLALNMWALLQVGHLVERLFGRKAYALLYFGSGIMSGLASMIWHGDKVWSAGASGAIFGIYGALFGFMLRDERLLPKSVYKPLLKSTALFVGYNLFCGAVQSGVDNAAHVGGLFAGCALGWLTTVPADPELHARFAARRFRAGIIAAFSMIGCAVVIVPRFDYSPVDELSWQKLNEPYVAKEPALIKRENSEINRYRSSGDPGKLSIWLTYEAIPFYDEWRNKLLDLPLEQKKLTYRRREAAAGILQSKIISFRHLLAAANGSDPYPLRSFEDETNAIAKSLRDTSLQ
jgi:rhomboid protease GluP